MLGRRNLLAVVISVLAAVALGISAYLTWVTWQSTSVAGCEAGSLLDCDDVLASRWSKWFGLPVSLLGALVYLGILGVVWPSVLRPQGLAVMGLFGLAMTSAGAAIWFISLQVFQLESFCAYCLTVHACGLVVSALALLLFLDSGDEYEAVQSIFAGEAVTVESSSGVSMSHLLGALLFSAFGLSGLLGGQLLSEPLAVAVLEEVEFGELVVSDEAPKETAEIASDEASTKLSNKPVISDSADEDIALSTARSSSPEPRRRSLAFQALPEGVDIAEMPLLGKTQAEHVLVEMMDYTCKHCRKLHKHLNASLEHYGDQLAIVIYHVPLSKKCNPAVKKDSRVTANACEYARLAICVWQLAPEKFPEFHDWLLASEKPPNISKAKKHAVSLVGTKVLTNQEIKADAMKRLSKQNANLQRLKTGLPVLLLTNTALRGVPEESEKLFAFLESKISNLRPANSLVTE